MLCSRSNFPQFWMHATMQYWKQRNGIYMYKETIGCLVHSSFVEYSSAKLFESLRSKTERHCFYYVFVIKHFAPWQYFKILRELIWSGWCRQWVKVIERSKVKFAPIRNCCHIVHVFKTLSWCQETRALKIMQDATLFKDL